MAARRIDSAVTGIDFRADSSSILMRPVAAIYFALSMRLQ
jgi:hypothetical protein